MSLMVRRHYDPPCPWCSEAVKGLSRLSRLIVLAEYFNEELGEVMTDGHDPDDSEWERLSAQGAVIMRSLQSFLRFVSDAED